MTDISKPGPTGKWEVVRRLRYGALMKLFRHRYGYQFPDDDAGRDDLFVLVCVVSLAPSATDKKMAHTIDMWAPWMPDIDVVRLVDAALYDARVSRGRDDRFRRSSTHPTRCARARAGSAIAGRVSRCERSSAAKPPRPKL